MDKRYFLPLLLIFIVIFSAFNIIFLHKQPATNTHFNPSSYTPSPKVTKEIPVPTSFSLTPPSLPSKFNWTSVPVSQIKTNKGVLGWFMDLRKCPPQDLNPKDRKFRGVGYSDLPGQEWVFYRKVTKQGQELYHDSIIDSGLIDWGEKINWLRLDYKVDQCYSFYPMQGVQSATYQPECIYGIRNGQIRVACLTRLVSESSTSGEGVGTKYIYPYTEEFRYFISDIASVSQLLSQVKFQ